MAKITDIALVAAIGAGIYLLTKAGQNLFSGMKEIVSGTENKIVAIEKTIEATNKNMFDSFNMSLNNAFGAVGSLKSVLESIDKKISTIPEAVEAKNNALLSGGLGFAGSLGNIMDIVSKQNDHLDFIGKSIKSTLIDFQKSAPPGFTWEYSQLGKEGTLVPLEKAMNHKYDIIRQHDASIGVATDKIAEFKAVINESNARGIWPSNLSKTIYEGGTYRMASSYDDFARGWYRDYGTYAGLPDRSAW